MLLNVLPSLGEPLTQGISPHSPNIPLPRLRNPDAAQLFANDTGHKVYRKDLL